MSPIYISSLGQCGSSVGDGNFVRAVGYGSLLALLGEAEVESDSIPALVGFVIVP